MGPCKNQCTIWQTLNEPYGRIVSVQVTTWETWSDHESPTSLHTRDVSLFSHMFMTVKAILWDYVHHMRDPTMSAMWIYKLPMRDFEWSGESLHLFWVCHYKGYGKMFCDESCCGQFQCSKEITWTCCHQKCKFCHFSTVKSCWEFMKIVLNALHDLAFLPEAFSIFNIPT